MKWSIMGVCLGVSVGSWLPAASGQVERADPWPDGVPSIKFALPEEKAESPALPLTKQEAPQPVPLNKPLSLTKPKAFAEPEVGVPSSETGIAEAKPTVLQPTEAKPNLASPRIAVPTVAKRKLVKPAPAPQPSAVRPMQVKPNTVNPMVVKPMQVKPSVVKPSVVKPMQVKPSVVKPSVVKPMQVKPNTVVPRTATPVDSADPIALVSRANVSVEVEPGPLPETIPTDSEDIPVAPSATCSSGTTSSCRSHGSCDCRSHCGRAYGRCRGMGFGGLCDDRCSPLWRGCFDVRRAGNDLYHHMNAQVMNGLAAQMILYRYDFLDEQGNEGFLLSRRGKAQLDKILKLWERSGSQIVIEPTKVAATDQQRRDEVLRQMADWGVQVDPQMVVVGRPNPTGLAGTEAELIYGNMLQNTQSRGAVSSGGDDSFGGFGGGDDGGSGSSR